MSPVAGCVLCWARPPQHCGWPSPSQDWLSSSQGWWSYALTFESAQAPTCKIVTYYICNNKFVWQLSRIEATYYIPTVVQVIPGTAHTMSIYTAQLPLSQASETMIIIIRTVHVPSCGVAHFHWSWRLALEHELQQLYYLPHPGVKREVGRGERINPPDVKSTACLTFFFLFLEGLLTSSCNRATRLLSCWFLNSRDSFSCMCFLRFTWASRRLSYKHMLSNLLGFIEKIPPCMPFNCVHCYPPHPY